MFSVRFPVHRFNWAPSPWQQIQNERAKIAAANTHFENAEGAFSNGLFTAITNDSTTSANDAVQEAIDRLQGGANSASGATSAQQSMSEAGGDSSSGSASTSTSSLGSLLDSVA